MNEPRWGGALLGAPKTVMERAMQIEDPPGEGAIKAAQFEADLEGLRSRIWHWASGQDDEAVAAAVQDILAGGTGS